MRKMNPKRDEGIFLGYSTNSISYRVFNSRTKVMMESVNIMVDDSTIEKGIDVDEDVETSSQQTDVLENKAGLESNIEPVSTELDNPQVNKGLSIRIQTNHLKEIIIGIVYEGITTRSRDVISNFCFVSKFEPKNVNKALTNEFWINDIQEELVQFKRNEVWDLVPRPEGTNIIGTKWTYKNKSDEKGIVNRNKARLVALGSKLNELILMRIFLLFPVLNP